MLESGITHPELISGLLASKKGSRIHLADAWYSLESKTKSTAKIIYLNFVPGVISGMSIAWYVAESITIEAVTYIHDSNGSIPPIINSCRTIFPDATIFNGVERSEFNLLASAPETTLVIVTGEQSDQFNLIFDIGATVSTEVVGRGRS